MNQRPAGYRADIDGLRAIAILGVVAFHLKPGLVPGGFLGVDAFFVISGFLITSIIQKGIEVGNFSVLEFYERRIRRIMPALFAVLCAMIVAGWWLMLPSEMMAFGKSMRYVLLSISNFHFLDEARDYFNEAAQGAPLLHTWSLAVEEQFYFVFPPVLLLLHRFVRSARHRVAVLWVLLAVSFAGCVYMLQGDAMTAFYMLPFRAWELLIGSCMAVGRFPAPGRTLSHVLGGAGLVLLLGGMLFLGDEYLRLMGGGLLPCVGVALLIHAGSNPDGVAGRVLSSKPVVLVGLISYSVYLWHWPLIVFAHQLSPESDRLWWLVGLFSVFAGWLSWRFVEEPFRDRTRFSRRVIFGGWLAATLLLLGVSLVIKKSGGWPMRFSEEVRHYLSFKKNPNAVRTDTKEHYDPNRAARFGAEKVAPEIAVWGDSHAGALVPELANLAREAGKSFLFFGIAGQAPVPGVVIAAKGNAERRDKYNRDVLAHILAHPELRVVVLHARWGYYAHGGSENGEASLSAFAGWDFASRSELENYYATRIRDLVTTLAAAGRTVVLIYPVPEAGINVPDMMARKAATGIMIEPMIPCADFEQRQAAALAALDACEGGIIRIKPHERLLDGSRLRVLHDGRPLYMDDDHLSQAGADYIKDMLETIFSLNPPPPASH